MTNNSIKTASGKTIMLYRTFTPNASLSNDTYLPPSVFKIGRNNPTPLITDTDLAYPLSIADGTLLDDGSNTLTGSLGGTNSTDNTTSYKEGAGATDATSQNLLTTGSNVSKVWTIANLAAAGTNASADQFTSCQIYIDSQTILDTIVSVEIRLGSDTSNYYSTTVLNADLEIGWNTINDGGILSTWDETGTVSGSIDTFVIVITTGDAADAFIAGDVLYDLLRQWETADITKSFTIGYPIIDLVNNEITTRGTLSTIEANGYLVNAIGLFNEDAVPLMDSIDTFDADSKSSTDSWAFVIVDRIL